MIAEEVAIRTSPQIHWVLYLRMPPRRGLGEMAAAPEPLKEDLASLDAEDLDLIVLELTDYADFLIRTKARWMPGGVLPRGFDASSLALEAIGRVLDGRRRAWDPEKEPTLLAYLKSVVKSIFSSELQPAAERLTEVAAVDESGRDLVSEAPSGNPGADDSLVVEELKERMLDCLDEEEDELVLLCLFEDITRPSEIADDTGIEVGEIYRIKRKVQRRLAGFREEA